jgi:long-chain acyl-CoA synthetase
MTVALMHHALEAAARDWSRRPALLADGHTVDFATLDTWSTALAHDLSARGVSAGTRVAVMLSNRPEFVVAVEAISKLGAVTVLLSPAWKSLEVGHAVGLTGPTHAMADGAGREILAGLVRVGNVLDVDSADFTAALSVTTDALPPAPVGPDNDAVLVFSSGTVGLPKAVRHTHASLGNAVQHWKRTLGLGPDDRFQVTTPPSLILGLLNLLTAIDARATVRLHRRFDLDELLRRIEDERMTLAMAVAPIALAMANHPRLEQYDLSSLRYIMWGATPVTPSVAETVTRRTGVRWLPAYGTSEVPVVAVNPVHEPHRWRLDSPGLPPAGVTLRVADLETAKVLPVGESGEIQVLSPSAMIGYLPEEANADVFADGWYRTGDVGWLDPDGWVHLTDRNKELIKVNGFQVAPTELEGLLLGHPDVVDCAVFGVTDEHAGERPVAAVQLAPDAAVTPESLRQLVADSLATYKQLRDVLVVESIPRLPSGKTLRRALRAQWEPMLTGVTHTEGSGV